MIQRRCSRNTILKRVIYTLYCAFCNVFLRPRCNGRCTMLCRGWCLSTTLPPANSVQTSASQQLLPGTTPSTPEQASAKASQRAFGAIWRRHPLLQKDDGQNGRTATQLSFSVIAKDTSCFLWTQSVWQITHLQPCPGVGRAGLLQGKGWVGSEVWPLWPPWCIPQHLNILGTACWWSQGSSTVLGVAKRPGPEYDI